MNDKVQGRKDQLIQMIFTKETVISVRGLLKLKRHYKKKRFRDLNSFTCGDFLLG